MPVILNIETSASKCSVSISNDTITYLQSEVPMAHAEVLANLIQQCVQESGISLSDLGAVAVSDGPGSYTGLRIGISTAKGLCLAINKPLIAINTLQIIAQAAKEQSTYSYYWPMIDARRMEVYHCIFNAQLEEQFPMNNAILDQNDFFNQYTQYSSIALCGDGALKASALTNIPVIEALANAKSMVPLSNLAFQNQQFVDLVSYEPNYLKQASITVAKKKAS
jgi:tRNA threonylcarbamoyladenosine biosynthesis protein TsaB